MRGRERVADIRVVEIATFLLCGIPIRNENVGNVRMVVGCPLVEMVRNIERCRIGRRVLKVHDNDLPIALCQYPPCNRKT